MMANPVLAELVRGNWVENQHRGAFVLVDALGDVKLSVGNVERDIFPRSAVKSMQALALFKSGAVGKFDLDSADIAMACASHHGQQVHIDAVTQLLRKIGATVEDLECGAHPPSNPAARKSMREQGQSPSALHNNCSGKHAGMLAVAKALGTPTLGYSDRDHPVQKLVRASMEELLGVTLIEQKCGTDGCSIPTWAAPLKSFALAFARMASGVGLEAKIGNASRQIFDAATAHPDLVGGSGAFDTDVMQLFGGNLMVKVGAEGVYCGAIRDQGLGFALKCDDGNMLAANAMIAALLAEVAKPNAAQKIYLEAQQLLVQKNWRKLEVSHMCAKNIQDVLVSQR